MGPRPSHCLWTVRCRTGVCSGRRLLVGDPDHGKGCHRTMRHWITSFQLLLRPPQSAPNSARFGKENHQGGTIVIHGIHRYPPMERVIYGIPLAEALAEEVERDTTPAPSMSWPAARSTGETDVIETVRRVLGNRLAGLCAKIGAHTPRTDVVAAANEARAAKADLILTVGGGSVTDAAKMVGLCLGNDITAAEQLDQFRAVHHGRRQDRASAREGAADPLGRCADHAFGRGVHSDGRLHRHGAKPEGKLRPSADDAAGGDPRSRGDGPHAGVAVPVHRHPRRRSRGGGHLFDQPDAILGRHVDAGVASAAAPGCRR